MQKTLRDFLETDCHEPPRAVVLGKGPSLDDYGLDRDRCGAFVVGLNEVAEVIPCHAAVHLDDFKLEIAPEVLVFRPPIACCSSVDCTYVFERDDKPPKPGREAYHLPHHGFGTATAAVTILGMWGIREILFAGFDSYPETMQAGYAKCLEGKIRRPSGGNRVYVGINKGIAAALTFYGIRALWFHQGERFDGRVYSEAV